MTPPTPVNPDAPAIAHRFFFGMLKSELIHKQLSEATDAVDEQFDTVPENIEPLDMNVGDMIDLNMQQKITTYSITLNAVTAETISWYNSMLSMHGHDQLPPERALEIATEAAQPPKDAILGEHGYETQGDRVSFVARWHHEHDGLPVESDMIRVMVNAAAGKPFAVYRVWRTPEVGANPTER